MAAREDWQVGKSLSECCGYMFTQQVACDVHFQVRYPGHPAEDIGAHAFILISRSPVIDRMLTGELRSSIIEIVDINPSAFMLMLRYLYTDEIELPADEVFSLIYAAKKYMIQSLLDICTKFLSEEVNSNNVCVILNQSILFDEKSLQDDAMRFIEDTTEEVAVSDGFLELTQEALLMIVRDDKLSIPEKDLMDAVCRWSEAECKRKEMSPSKENKRNVLGEILGELRYHTLSPEDFATFVSKSSILNDAEVSRVFLQMHLSKDKIPPPEVKGERQGVRRYSWLEISSGQALNQNVEFCGSQTNKFTLEVHCDKPMDIQGFRLGRCMWSGRNETSIININISTNEARRKFRVTPQHDAGYEQCFLVYLSEEVKITPPKCVIGVTYIAKNVPGFVHPVEFALNSNSVFMFKTQGNMIFRGASIQCTQNSSVVKAVLIKRGF